MKSVNKKLSIIIPVHNEEDNLPHLYRALNKICADLPILCDFFFVDDGSYDNSLVALHKLAKKDKRIHIIELSRNFGKEVAVTAGLHAATGDAAMIMDADMQHPINLIPEFVAKWLKGADIVIGVRKSYGTTRAKKINSWLFYKLLNSMAEVKVKPNATDFRLLDRIVINEFNKFSERNRITRGLIDWLGFKREYVYFDAAKRLHGKANYGIIKLFRLAINSFVGLSLFPLRLAGYIGVIITIIASALGIFIFTEKYILHDPLKYHISGSAALADMNMLLIGVVLMSLGLVALYIANIHSEVINRPLYVVRKHHYFEEIGILQQTNNLSSETE
ncbi:MAG: glycosyltransferase family 2 protein [Candidatus Saccharimonadales bacterium]